MRTSPIHVLMVWVCLLCGVSLAMPRQRNMAGHRGVWCDGSVLKEVAATSALRCAKACSSDVRCVAYSQQQLLDGSSRCLLHDDFCAPLDLLTEPTGLYAGETIL